MVITARALLNTRKSKARTLNNVTILKTHYINEKSVPLLKVECLLQVLGYPEFYCYLTSTLYFPPLPKLTHKMLWSYLASLNPMLGPTISHLCNHCKVIPESQVLKEMRASDLIGTFCQSERIIGDQTLRQGGKRLRSRTIKLYKN